ncbi:MAG: hypothetical protein K6347_03660 [Campylobacterales bacterium]
MNDVNELARTISEQLVDDTVAHVIFACHEQGVLELLPEVLPLIWPEGNRRALADALASIQQL